MKTGITSKKRILIFVPEFPGLTETFIVREVSKLAESPSLQVELISIKKGSGNIPDDLEKHAHYVKLNRKHVIFGLKYVFLYPKRAFKALLLGIGNKNRSFFGRLYLFIKSLGYAVIFEGYSPDLVYAHFMSESSTLGMFVSVLLDTEFAISGHAKDVLQENGPVAENVELIAQKVACAKFITVCNVHAYNKLLEKAGSRHFKNIYLRYHGIDARWLKNSLKHASKLEVPRKHILFSIGRFVEKKGFSYLVGAADILRTKNIDFKLYIAGASGPLYEGILDMIRILDLEDHVEVVGKGKGLPFDEILKYYKIANVFVLPSINIAQSDADGIPNVLIEAAVLNIPIVTTDAGSIKEFITNKEGMTVKQRDPKDLARGLEKVLKSKELQKRITKNAHDKATEMFNLDDNVKEIESLLLS